MTLSSEFYYATFSYDIQLRLPSIEVTGHS